MTAVARMAWLLVALLGLTQGARGQAGGEPPRQKSWLMVEIGIIGAASDDILKTALEDVERNRYAGLVIELDTPGGALDATRAMVKAIMAAPVPVVVWVGPAGSRAGSAGAFITLAGHVAAMAPGTNIGAAHPVEASGGDIAEGDMRKKIENDTVAFIESIARTRGRNIEMARSFVMSSLSISAEEALENNVIDLLATSSSDLMTKLDGRKVVLEDGREQILATKGAELVVHERTLRQSILEILSNPNLFYLLFIAGLIGIAFELTHPGAMVPGVLGAISLILALIATAVLPVSYGAMLLVVISLAFMVAELFVPSFGILGLGGFAGFLIGSLLLVDPSNEQGLRISWLTIVPGAMAIGAFLLAITYLVVRADRSKVVSGAEGMIGQRATALSPFAQGRGQVRCMGEIWKARLVHGDDLEAGRNVVVTAVNGLELLVEPRENAASSANS